MAEVTARIKLRTEAPSNNILENGEVFISTTNDEIDIYVGDGTTTISQLKPNKFIVNGSVLEPKTIGGFTNNGTDLSGGQLTANLLALGSDSVGSQLPTQPKEGQIFFLIQQQ